MSKFFIERAIFANVIAIITILLEQKAIDMLCKDPQMRTEFLNRVAGPIANKMFECGMIP